jgi:SAM-dependent methyltransferase
LIEHAQGLNNRVKGRTAHGAPLPVWVRRLGERLPAKARRAEGRRSLWPMLALLDMRDRVRGDRDPLVPPRRYRLPGWYADSRGIGNRWLEIFRNEIGLRGDERVLDIGCGSGRIAAPLTASLVRGSYEGFDVDRRSVGWCRRAITSRYPNFRFQVADIHNALYNPGGSQAAVEYRFPFPDAQFDLALSLSVFTHMTPSETAHYLREAARVLRPGGRLLATFFLLNEETERLQANGSPERRYRFRRALTDSEDRGYRSVETATPEATIAHYETSVHEMCERSGLQVERTNRGNWSRGTAGRAQDLIVAVRS